MPALYIVNTAFGAVNTSFFLHLPSNRYPTTPASYESSAKDLQMLEACALSFILDEVQSWEEVLYKLALSLAHFPDAEHFLDFQSHLGASDPSNLPRRAYELLGIDPLKFDGTTPISYISVWFEGSKIVGWYWGLTYGGMDERTEADSYSKDLPPQRAELFQRLGLWNQGASFEGWTAEKPWAEIVDPTKKNRLLRFPVFTLNDHDIYLQPLPTGDEYEYPIPTHLEKVKSQFEYVGKILLGPKTLNIAAPGHPWPVPFLPSDLRKHLPFSTEAALSYLDKTVFIFSAPPNCDYPLPPMTHGSNMVGMDFLLLSLCSPLQFCRLPRLPELRYQRRHNAAFGKENYETELTPTERKDIRKFILSKQPTTIVLANESRGAAALNITETLAPYVSGTVTSPNGRKMSWVSVPQPAVVSRVSPSSAVLKHLISS